MGALASWVIVLVLVLVGLQALGVSLISVFG